MRNSPTVLLSSVFGPYGVDDSYGRKENIMELFHNQVTREQGLFSFRSNHQSFGLHLIAENINADTTIIDFPTEKRFVREIKKGYDYVGISFIVPNFVKAQRMAELVHAHASESKIVLGGHGTSIVGIEHLIDADFICRSEGIRFFRDLLGEDTERAVSHPLVPSAFNKRIMGAPLGSESIVLMPGVGCPNACRFCCTSHFFDKKYTPFLKTGREIFDVCERAEEELGFTDFFVMDENFLKYRQRVDELLEELERHDKHYTFNIFSSAEAVQDVGIEYMKRLGVCFLWIGMEGRKETYAKNRGVDFKQLVAELRANGIVVLGSVILFSEHHTKETIHEDIEYAIDVAPDFIQFMQLGPFPGTALHECYEKNGKLRKDIPFEEWHGQHRLWFDHPHFTAQESELYLQRAFLRAWDELGSSVLRAVETYFLGYLSTQNAHDPRLQSRHEFFKRCCATHYPSLDVIRRHAHNEHEKNFAESLKKRFKETFGPMTTKQKLMRTVLGGLAFLEARRVAGKGNLRQPTTVLAHFDTPLPQPATAIIEGRTSQLSCEFQSNPGQAALTLAGELDRVSAKALYRRIGDYFHGGTRNLSLDISALDTIRPKILKYLLRRTKPHHKRLSLVFSTQQNQLSHLISDISDKFSDLTVKPTMA